MLTGEIRARLAADPSLGAGNFLQHVRRVRPGDEEVLWGDPDFLAPGGGTETVLTLDRLNELVETYAGWYAANGVRPRDPVAVHTGSATEIMVNFLALSGLGAVPALVNANLSAATAADYIRRVQATAAFTDAARAPVLGSVDGVVPVTSEQIRPGCRADLPETYPYRHDPLDPVLITHSSGTTGVPKAVCANHGGFFAATRYRLTRPLPQGHGRVLSALPPSHNSGVTMVMLSLLTGMPVRILGSQDADTVLAAIEEFRPSMVAAFSSTYAELAGRDLTARDLSSVVLWYNSGDAAHRAHIRAVTRVGHHVEVTAEGRRVVPGSLFHDGLGSSEMGHSLFHQIHRPGEERPARCVGRPYEFVEAAILSAVGEELPPYRVGRLGVRSPTVTPGYWNDSVTTYRSRLRGYWLTGDLAYRDENGHFYHVDRVTDAISTIGGDLYSVWAEELLLDAFPELDDCTIVEATAAGERPPDAYALLDLPPARRGAGTGWTRRINEVLAGEGMPPIARAYVIGSDDLPLGPTGKVKKRELRLRYRAAIGDRAGAAGGEST
jgi:acyl-coenzyme A synthetase/AMP-(fatty) acid ligase